MIELQKIRLGDICKFQNGYAFKSKDFISDGQYKVVKIKELKNGKVKFFQDTATIDLNIDEYECYSIKCGDVLFALTGDPVNKNNPLSWVGRVAIYQEDNVSLLNQRVCKVITDEKTIIKEYIYYYFRLFENFYSLAAKATGSASQANISTKTIADTEMMIPAVEMQRRIVKILASIDNKINNNNQINENLEQQAQALFDKMFGKNSSTEWKQGVLSDISIITMGQSPSGSSYNEDGDGMVFFQGRTDFGFRFPSQRLFTTEPKRIAEANDILMSVRAPVGDLNIAAEKCCIGRGLGAIKSKDNHQSFVLYTMFALKTQLNVFNGEGTVFGSINRDSLNSMTIVIPSLEEMDKFESIVSPMDKMIRNNYEENCRLQVLRDSLLPKLMLGEMDVSNVVI